MNNGEIRLVCFDLGGVIVRICRSWAQACNVLGYEVHEAVAHPDRIRQRRAVWGEHQTGRMPDDEFWRKLAQATGDLYAPEQARAVHAAWLLGEYDGVVDLIGELNATGCIETACLSNTDPHHWETMSGYASVRSMRHRFASHLLGLAKPDRAIFEAFEAQTGCRGREIVFFEDSPENVEAARAAGWHAELVDHEGDTAGQMREHLRGFGVL